MGSGLHGRVREQQMLAGFLAKVRQGESPACGLVGEAGVGKSALVAWTVERAREDRIPVVALVGDPVDHQRPFANVGPLLAEASVDAEATAEVVLAAVLALATAPILVAVDDLHWLDQDSLWLFRELLRRRHATSLGLLVASRTDHRVRVCQLLLDEIDARGALLRIDPLAGDDVWRLVTEIAGAVPGPRLRALLDGAGGLPLLILDAMHAAEEQGVIETTGDVADLTRHASVDLTRVVRWHFDQLSESQRSLVRAISIFGVEADLTEVAALLGTEPGHLATDVDAIRRAGIVTPAADSRLRLRHPLVQEAVYESIEISERLALHRQAAQRLEQRQIDAATSQIVLAAGPEDRQAADKLASIAMAHLEAGRPRTAGQLLRIAVDLSRDDAAAQDRLALALATAERASGRPRASLDILDEVAATGSEQDVRAEALRELIDLLFDGLDVDGLRRALARFARLFEHAMDPAEMIACRTLCDVHQSPERTREVGDAGIAMMVQSGAYEQRARLHFALSHVLGERGYLGECIDHVRQAVELGRRHRLAGLELWTAWLAIVLSTADRHEEARTVLSELDTPSSARHRVHLETADFCLAVATGNWSRAQTASQAVVTATHHLPPILAFRALIVAVLARHTRDALLAAGVDGLLSASAPLSDESVTPMTTANQLVGRFHLALLRGRRDEALSLTLAILDLARQTGKIEMLWKAGTEQVILLAEGARVDSRLRPDLDDFTASLDENATRMTTPTGWLLSACAEAGRSDDPDAWQVVLDRWEPTGRKDLELPLLEGAALCVHRHGRPVWAHDLLDRAEAVATGLGAPWTRPVLDAQRQPIFIDRLTRAEHAVVELARTGLTNEAIARRLGVARGTVATHLTRAYRKLGVGSRVDLILALAISK